MNTDLMFLDGLTAARELLSNLRLPFAGINNYAWEKLYRVDLYLKTQQLALGDAYFADSEPTPEPAYGPVFTVAPEDQAAAYKAATAAQDRGEDFDTAFDACLTGFGYAYTGAPCHCEDPEAAHEPACGWSLL